MPNGHPLPGGFTYLRKSFPKGTKRWVARIPVSVDPLTRKTRFKDTYHHTQKEAKEALSKLQEDRRDGKLRVGKEPTVKEYLEGWVEQIETLVEPKTYAQYRYFAEKILSPYFGPVRLGAVTRADARRFFTEVQRIPGRKEKLRGPKWYRNLLGVARKAWNDAIDAELIAVNPFTRVPLPKVRKRRFSVWTPAQVATFFRAVGDDPDRNLYIVAVFSGGRAGELLALHRSDVDFARGTITIGRSVSRVDGQGLVVKEPKSDAGWRTVTVHPLGMEALRRQIDLVDSWGIATPLVFPSERTGRVRYVEFPRKKLRRLCETLKLPVLRFHDLRHLHAALLIALGVHAKVIQARLGHSRIDVTMDTYGWLMEGIDQDASGRLGGLIGAGLEPPATASEPESGNSVVNDSAGAP